MVKDQVMRTRLGSDSRQTSESRSCPKPWRARSPAGPPEDVVLSVTVLPPDLPLLGPRLAPERARLEAGGEAA